MMTISETATAVSVVIAALSFVYGVSAWRREFVGKRRIELAEEVLALAYEIEEIIGSIRNRLVYVPQSNDSGEKDQARSLADSIMERICSSQERFATFQSYKYRFNAMFGDDIDLSFCEIMHVRNIIATSVEMLAKDYWPPIRSMAWIPLNSNGTVKVNSSLNASSGIGEKITIRSVQG